MCGDTMDFPETPMEFIERYSFKDSKEYYTNGSELVPVFRVEQMLEHYCAEPVVRCKECKESEQSVYLPCGTLYCGVWDTAVRCDGYCYQGAQMIGGTKE